MFSFIALLTGVLIITEAIRPWHIIATSLATGVLLSFDIPSRQAMLPNLVKRGDIVNAIAMYAILPSGAAIIGPAFFAPIVNLWGLEGLFFTIGIAYVLTVAMLAMMEPLIQRRAQERATIWRGLLQGFSYIRGNRGIVTLIALGVVAGMFGMSFQTLLPIFADRILLGGVESYSYLLLSEGIGGLIGTLTLVWLVTQRNSPRILLLTGIGFGLGLVAFSQVAWLPASVVAMGLVGGFGVMFVTANSSIVQGLVAEEFRGRVMSIHQLTWGTTSIGGLLLGLLAQSVSAPFALTLGGLVTAGATFVMGSGLLRLLSEPNPTD